MRGTQLSKQPVALMRLVEIDEVSEATRRVPERQLWVEPKFNGWLTQVVGGKIFTRRGKDLTLKFPLIAGLVAGFATEHLIGELVYWNERGIMDEPMVTHIAGTKDPLEIEDKTSQLLGFFQLVLFDAIMVEGMNISERPTIKRRELLEALIPEDHALVTLSPVFKFGSLESVYRKNVAAGGDGVVLKNSQAPYFWRPLGEHEPRPEGVWYKLKPAHTEDFVVTGLHRGPKGRLVVELGQYHAGQPVHVSDMSNISRDDEKVFERKFRKEGPFIVEVEYQGRFQDPPGALQHPRLVRIREDIDHSQVVLPARFMVR